MKSELWKWRKHAEMLNFDFKSFFILRRENSCWSCLHGSMIAQRDNKGSTGKVAKLFSWLCEQSKQVTFHLSTFNTLQLQLFYSSSSMCSVWFMLEKKVGAAVGKFLTCLTFPHLKLRANTHHTSIVSLCTFGSFLPFGLRSTHTHTTFSLTRFLIIHSRAPYATFQPVLLQQPSECVGEREMVKFHTTTQLKRN